MTCWISMDCFQNVMSPLLKSSILLIIFTNKSLKTWKQKYCVIGINLFAIIVLSLGEWYFRFIIVASFNLLVEETPKYPEKIYSL